MQPTEIHLINLGDELLNGKRLNTHTQEIALKLAPLGLVIKENTITRDDKEAIRDAVRNAWSHHSIVITTGGLGPTNDDNTREGIAEALGVKLVFSKDVEKKLETFFRAKNKAMSENNLKQCYYFEGSNILNNPNGTAPGLYLKKDHKLLFSLPGPPQELIPMLQYEVIPRLKKDVSLPPPRPQLHVRTAGMGECFVEEAMETLKKLEPSLEIAYCAHLYFVDIYFSWSPKTAKHVETQLKNAITEKLKNHLLCFGSGSLEEILVRSLKDKKQTLSVAESCTGGLISHLITKIPDVSDVFLGGATTYSNAAKHALLGIPEELIQRCGAVSPEVAESMAYNTAQKHKSDYALSTTGIAGPSGGSVDKPVGLVYIGLHTHKQTIAHKYIFSGSRNAIQERASYAALDLLRQVIHNPSHE